MANMTTQEILQGIKDWAAPKVIYDISAAHNNTKYTDLADALGTDGENIPQEYKKGGITVRFVRKSDNKYVQARCMAQNFTTDVTQWQGVDDEPTANSENLVKSGGIDNVFKRLYEKFSFEDLTPAGQFNGYLRSSGVWYDDAVFATKYYAVTKGQILKVHHGEAAAFAKYGFFTQVPSTSASPTSFEANSPATSEDIITAPDDGYITCSNVGDKDTRCENMLNVAKIVTEEDKKLQLVDKTSIYDILYKLNLLLRKNIGTAQNPSYVNLSEILIPSATYNKTGLESTADKKIILDGAITYESLEAAGVINGYYLNNNGVFRNNSYMLTKYYAVQAGDVVRIHYGDAAGYAKFGFFTNIPTSESTPTHFEPNTFITSYDIIVVPGNGYITCSNEGDKDTRCEKAIYNEETFNKIYSNILDLGKRIVIFEDLTPAGQFNGYLRSSNGTWAQTEVTTFVTKYYAVTKGQILRVHHGSNAAFAKYGFFTQVPSTSVLPNSFASNTPATSEDVIIAPDDGYITCSNEGDKDTRCEADIQANIGEILKNLISNYYDKKCLYIGDSISTNNNYYWKGYLEEQYKFNYVRNQSPLAPANGGITLVPPVTEDSDNTRKSIWYRCAEGRMSNYNFDIISLFGGTNDMVSSSLVIGTINDIPFVDDAETITSETVTDVRPQNLSLSSALQGCILMLKRDFPTKEIVIPTVMYSQGYGNWTDIVTGKMASEAIALLQMQIASKYDLKAIPLYWDMRQESTINVFTRDGVHPNQQGARRIVSMFVQTLCLK